MAFAIPLPMLLVRALAKALPEGVGKPWAWFAAAFVFVLAAKGPACFRASASTRTPP